MPAETILLRFVLCLFPALTYGIARQRLGKPIGFGTFSLVALGSAVIGMIAVDVAAENPLPLLSAVVTGIGFLGAGALLRTGERVSGFTSAATIWIHAVFGLAIGTGEYLLGGLVYTAIWAVTILDQRMQRRWDGAHQRRLTVVLPAGEVGRAIERDLGLPERESALQIQVDREAQKATVIHAATRTMVEDHGLLERLQNDPRIFSYGIE